MEYVWIVFFLGGGGTLFILWKKEHSVSVLICVVWEGTLVSFFGAPTGGLKPLALAWLSRWAFRNIAFAVFLTAEGGAVCCSSVDLSQVLQVQRQPCISVVQHCERTERMLTHEKWSHWFTYAVFCPCARQTGIEAFKVQPVEVLDVAQEPLTPLVQRLTWVMRLFEHLYDHNIGACQPHVMMSLYMPKAYEMWHPVYEESAKELLFMLFYKNEDIILRWSNIVGYH